MIIVFQCTRVQWKCGGVHDDPFHDGISSMVTVFSSLENQRMVVVVVVDGSVDKGWGRTEGEG